MNNLVLEALRCHNKFVEDDLMFSAEDPGDHATHTNLSKSD